MPELRRFPDAGHRLASDHCLGMEQLLCSVLPPVRRANAGRAYCLSNYLNKTASAQLKAALGFNVQAWS